MHKAGDIIALIVILAIIAVVIAPRSKAPGVIQALGNSFAGAIGAATRPVTR